MAEPFEMASVAAPPNSEEPVAAALRVGTKSVEEAAPIVGESWGQAQRNAAAEIAAIDAWTLEQFAAGVSGGEGEGEGDGSGSTSDSGCSDGENCEPPPCDPNDPDCPQEPVCDPNNPNDPDCPQPDPNELTVSVLDDAVFEGSTLGFANSSRVHASNAVKPRLRRALLRSPRSLTGQ
jgi:hypothetical protein